MQGLVFSYLLDGKGGARPVGWREILDWTPADGVLWLHLDYSEPEAAAWLTEKSGIAPIICDALVEENTRPRLLASAGSALMVLRGMNFNPGADPEDMVSLRLWAEHDRVISTRQRKVMAIEDIKNLLEKGEGPSTSGGFVAMVTDRITQRMGDIIEDVIEEVDDLEEEVIATTGSELRQRLADVRRQVITLRRHIAPQRETIAKLAGMVAPWLPEEDRHILHEAAERTIRYIEELDSAREKALVTHEEMNSKVAEQTGKTMYLLSIVAAIFLPLSFITGLLGINVGGIPGTDYKWAFLLVCAALGGIGVIQLLVFKLKKWI